LKKGRAFLHVSICSIALGQSVVRAQDLSAPSRSNVSQDVDLIVTIEGAVKSHPFIAVAKPLAGADLRASKWQHSPSFSVRGLYLNQTGKLVEAQAVIDQLLWSEARMFSSICHAGARHNAPLAAALDEGRTKLASLKATKARIEAELFDKPLVFPEDVQDFPDLLVNQRQLFSKRRNAQTQGISALNHMLRLMRQELAMNMPLLQNGNVSRAEVVRLEHSVAKIEGDLALAEQTLAQRMAALAGTAPDAPTDGKKIEIQPGMTANTEILSRYNTGLNYLFNPIIKTVDQSLVNAEIQIKQWKMKHG